ncbi:hypothetical protein [Aureibaculum marinum]|nr:hypothetical protein [Aureibaculum marinum]
MDVKVEINKGCYGWEASGISTRELAVVVVIEYYKSFLIGKDPRRIGAV